VPPKHRYTSTRLYSVTSQISLRSDRCEALTSNLELVATHTCKIKIKLLEIRLILVS
jgi:hypothetical protein